MPGPLTTADGFERAACGHEWLAELGDGLDDVREADGDLLATGEDVIVVEDLGPTANADRSEDCMGKLIYAINTSIDGFTEDATGSFDWSVPDETVHLFHNDLMRGIGTQLLGRRMYETMAVWETEPSLAEESPVLADFAAAWQDSDKIVYSTTLTDPVTTRTRIVPAFEADEVRASKEASSADLLVGGPGLAAHALRAGVVDELLLTLLPVAVGAGKPALPTDLRLDLELIDERRFGNGAVHVAYRVRH